MPNITHTFVSGIADDATAAAKGEVLPSHWNAVHQFVFDGVPATDTSPGTPGMLAFDNAGNLFLCYAANQWAKFVGDVVFGINHLLLRDASSFLLLRNGVDKILLGHK